MFTPGHRHRVVLLAIPPAQAIDIVGPLEVFAQANAQITARGQEPPYETTLAALAAGPLETSSGVPMLASHGLFGRMPKADTLIVSGGRGARLSVADERLVARLRTLCRQVPRVVSICTGAFPLAATGLLDGRRVATHWAHCADLAARFPALEVDADAIFVSDGKFHSSAGVTAGIDLALALVEQDLGRDLALSVARHLVVFLKRPGGQSQFSTHLMMGAEAGTHDADRFNSLTAWIAANLAEDLSVEALAHRVAMSPRNFARRFRAAIGTGPGDYVRRLRIEASRRMLTDSDLPVGAVAARCGFGTPETMRLAFQRHLRVSPQEFRERFRLPSMPQLAS
jgi:transcriptional regulator GlxA family with amidase domain